jgi:hypothetical protein
MMILLVTGNNYLIMFVGWEGVGICSYLLVNFWFTRIAANQSSLSALLTNRVGDTLLTVGMFAIIWSFGNLDYSIVFSLAPYYNENIITIIGICLLIGATAKSSQVGLHIWLPQAMEGPTPVSALIHAATMVTAGVYLLMRSSPLIEYSSTVLVLCLWLGAITTVFSSLIGLFQQDIKKVIAYSTMSQLAREHNILIMFINQTICVEIISYIINSQITKALKYYYNIYISNIFFNSFINLYWLFLFTLNKTEKWKNIIVRKLVGISEAIRLMLVYISFIYFKIIKFYDSKKYSTVSTINETNQSSNQSNQGFNEWLAGLIDGDGHFILHKSGSARLYIVMDIRDKGALYEILHRFGGSIRPIAGAKALRYNLSNKKGLIKLIEAVNGNIRNPARLLQMNKLCNKYDITLNYPNPLTYNNGWLSGFIDSDGSIYFSESSGQVFISATQKNIYLLEPLINIYGGRVDPSNDRGEAFKYIIYRKKEIFNMIDNYFNKYPLRTLKSNRLKLIKEYYVVRTYKDTDILKLNEWVTFKDKWERYKY